MSVYELYNLSAPLSYSRELICEFIPAGVDTAGDLERVRRLIEAGG